MVIFKIKPELSPVFCDMLSITLQLQPEEQQAVLDAMAELVVAGYAMRSFKGGRYGQSICIGIGENNETRVLVQAAPKQPHMAFLRVEFNPAKSAPADVGLFFDYIIPNGGYARLFHQGICTRVDVAVDLHSAAIDKLLFWIPGLTVSRVYAKGSKAESLVYGSPMSDRQVKVYDKVKQLKKALKKPFKADIPLHPVTRIEVQLTRRFPVKDLGSLKSPLSDIAICNPSKTIFNDDWGRLFLLACEAYGPLRALAELTENKAIYQEKLKTAAVTWWNPTALWEQWGGVVDGIINPPQWFKAPVTVPAVALAGAGSTAINQYQ